MTGKRRKRGGRRCKRQRLKSGEEGGEKELIISFTLGVFSARPHVKYSYREKESDVSCVMLRIVKGGAICSCRMKLR